MVTYLKIVFLMCNSFRDTLDQGLVIYGSQDKSDPFPCTPVYVIKFYWNIAMSICLWIVCGCFYTTVVELTT